MARTESQATPHPLFSQSLNSIKRRGQSIMQPLSATDCGTKLFNVAVYIEILQ